MKSTELTQGRTFQLWEYWIRHGSLLIRSPHESDSGANINFIFKGVEYVEAPRFPDELILQEPEASESFRKLSRLPEALRGSLEVLALQTDERTFFVAVVSMEVREHFGEMLESPFPS